VEITVTSQLVALAERHSEEWLGSRLYVPPGGTIWVEPMAGTSVAGWKVRLGAQTDDVSGREEWTRWPRVSVCAPIAPKLRTTLYTPFGGLLYFVRSSSSPSSAVFRCGGNAVQQPLVSLAAGIDVGAFLGGQQVGGWVDCEGERVILTLPASRVRAALAAGADVAAALRFWDALWDSYDRLSPRTDPRRQRIVPDVQTSHGWMHAGYPIMTNYGEVVDATAEKPIPWILDAQRLKAEGNWGLFHELGHNMQRDSWTFEGTVEVTVNLFTLWGFSQLCRDRVKEYATPPPTTFCNAGCPRAEWNRDPFLALKTYAQVLDTFGWAPLQTAFKEYAEEEKQKGSVSRDYAQQVRDFVRRWSVAVGRDLRPHWRRWGFGDDVFGSGSLKDPDPLLASLEPWTAAF